MQVGKTKDQGLYNKPSAAVHPVGISRLNPTTIQFNTSKVISQNMTSNQISETIFKLISTTCIDTSQQRISRH